MCNKRFFKIGFGGLKPNEDCAYPPRTDANFVVRRRIHVPLWKSAITPLLTGYVLGWRLSMNECMVALEEGIIASAHME